MNSNRFLALASALSCALTVSVHAQTQQPVAFLGDNIVYQWGQTAQFTANTNWTSYGAQVHAGPGNVGAGTIATLNTLNTIIGTGKKPIIFLEVGESDSEAVSPGEQHSSIFASFAYGLDQIIQAAQQAKLTIIVATIPYSAIGDKSDLNKWIFTYCNNHSIPVVNLDWALNSGVGFAASGRDPSRNSPVALPQAPVYYQPPTTDPNTGLPVQNLTAQGYDLITDMAQAAILQAEGYKLQSGYLDTVVWNEGDGDYSTQSANSLNAGGIVQFTAYGQYSDGSTHAFRNADLNGHIGRWENSNSMVMTLDQNGVGVGMDRGSSNVHFVTPLGAKLNEWIMYTQPNEYGCGDCIQY